ncbi:hypothetical protein [Kribbella sp. NPDC051620]|uniref:hypothetical protein n=1 Tax=Kribbella sp. NPDC051620 TaxID=3364120 RepID=UPI0037B667CC
MLRPLVAVTAATLLLAGCSGGDDKSSSSSDDGNNANSASTPTPSTPDLPSFDQPKAFSLVTAIAYARPDGPTELYGGKGAIVGKTAMYVNKEALHAVAIDGSYSWQALSSDVKSTVTEGYTTPTAVQLDGKEVIAIAYAQNVEAGGTQKAHGEVVFKWLDPADGKVLSTATAVINEKIGGGVGSFDRATGQGAITVSAGGSRTAGTAVFADPVTKKATVIPDLGVAGVSNGVVVGDQGSGQEGATNLKIAVVDGATGKVKKAIPIPAMSYLIPQTAGKTHAYIVGDGYRKTNKYGGVNVRSIFAVNFATGAMVETKRPDLADTDDNTYDCSSDGVDAVVCRRGSSYGNEQDEILGFDDSTGKKSWEYTTKSSNRVVLDITTVYNGYVYGKAEKLPAVLDAKTGEDVPVPAPTPSAGATPTPGETPTDGSSPGDGSTPGESTPSAAFGQPGLVWGEPQPPVSVSKYGSVYLQDGGTDAPLNTEKTLVIQKAIG